MHRAIVDTPEHPESLTVQTRMGVNGESRAKSWSDFANLSQSNLHTEILELSEYNRNGELLKGSADELVAKICHVYNHLKLRRIPPNCCLQLEIRSIYDKCPRESKEEKDERNTADNNNKNRHKRESFQTIDDILRKCIDSPFNTDNNDNIAYKRYEIVSVGTEMVAFEASKSDTSAIKIMDQFCKNDSNVLITTRFEAYHDGINVCVYINYNDVNDKLFGQRIFEHDLLTTLPSFFEVNTIDKEIEKEIKSFLQFQSHTIYKNEHDEEKKSSDDEYPIFELKLTDIVNDINKIYSTSMHLEALKQIFIGNGVDLSFFERLQQQKNNMDKQIIHEFEQIVDNVLNGNNTKQSKTETECNRAICLQNKKRLEELERLRRENQSLLDKLARYQCKVENTKSGEVFKKKKGKNKKNKSKKEKDDQNRPYPPINGKHVDVMNINMKEVAIDKIDYKQIEDVIEKVQWSNCTIYHSKYPKKTAAPKSKLFVDPYQLMNKIKESIHPINDYSADDVMQILKNHAFKEINCDKLASYKETILSYFEENKIDGKYLINTKRAQFGRDVAIYNDKNKNLTEPSRKLYTYLMEFHCNRSYSYRENRHLIPMVMNDRKSCWIEYLMIVNFENGANIGISLGFDDKNTIKITGIHLDKEPLIKRHQLISNNHYQCKSCKCLDSFNFVFNEFAWGNSQELMDTMKSFRARYRVFKPFIYKFINQNPKDGYQKLREEAIYLVKGDSVDTTTNRQ